MKPKNNKPKGRPVSIVGARVVKVTLGTKHREIAARFDSNNLSNGVRKALEYADEKRADHPPAPIS